MIAIIPPSKESGTTQPFFERGQLIRHKRYGYRGVVVERDNGCKADDAWYAKNMTQPDRDQPWYHILVDETSTCTYAASENLVADPSGQPTTHPLLHHFFGAFKEGRYLRNDTPWPA